MQKAPNEPQEMPEDSATPPPQQEVADATPPSAQRAPSADALNERIPESIKHPKEGLSKEIQAAKDTIVGSKSIPTEINTLKDSYVDFFKTSITSNLKALGKLATLHPIKAVKEFATGTTGNLGNIVNIVTSPARFAVAGGASVVDLAKKTAELPFKAASGIVKSPLWVWDQLDKGTGKLFDLGNKIQAWNKAGFHR